MNNEINWEETYTKNVFTVRDIQFSLLTMNNEPRMTELGNSYVIVTAWNPNNVKLPLDENRKRNLLLEEDIKKAGYSYEPCVGGLDDHSEESFIVFNITKDVAFEWGRKYEQFSVFVFSTFLAAYYKVSDESIIIVDGLNAFMDYPRESDEVRRKKDKLRVAEKLTLVNEWLQNNQQTFLEGNEVKLEDIKFNDDDNLYGDFRLSVDGDFVRFRINFIIDENQFYRLPSLAVSPFGVPGSYSMLTLSDPIEIAVDRALGDACEYYRLHGTLEGKEFSIKVSDAI